MEVHVDVSRFIDVGAERKRLEKQKAELAKFIAGSDAKLANKASSTKRRRKSCSRFATSSPEQREQLASVEAALKKLG